ncbi:MAG: FG-GAP repeat protein [Deltaproteobacteria bacterium]|nr:FG-GAP repeat protein [Deltaproteobacteria bacterium]
MRFFFLVFLGFLFLFPPKAWPQLSGTFDLSADFDAELTGKAMGDYSGYSVSSAGDVNCDGTDDVIIGAPFNDDGASNAGAAFVVFGPVTSSVNLGSADIEWTGEAASDYAGYDVAGAGDLNGDGCDDVLIGAIYQDATGTNAGRVYLFYGSSSLAGGSLSTSDVLYDGTNAGDYAGTSVAGAGDVNGDGYDDILIGAPGNDLFRLNAGAVYLVFGSSSLTNMVLTGADVRFFGEYKSDYAGTAVSGAGDFNGDGLADILIGSWDNNRGGNDSGAAYLILGKTTPFLRFSYLSAADMILAGENASDSAGYAVASGGDVNGDGYDDLFIGARYNDDLVSNGGAAYVVFGRDTLTRLVSLSSADIKLQGDTLSERAGSSVAGAGDVNADGYDDLLVGAPYNVNGGFSAGAVYLVYGGSGLSPKIALSGSDAIFEGGKTYDYAGFTVSGAGNIDGDAAGYADILIGAYWNDDYDWNAGSTYLFFGE